VPYLPTVGPQYDFLNVAKGRELLDWALEHAEELEAEAEIGGSVEAGGLGGAVALPFIAGYLLYYDLRSQPWFDKGWKQVGADLDDAWHSLSRHWTTPKHTTFQDVQEMMQTNNMLRNQHNAQIQAQNITTAVILSVRMHDLGKSTTARFNSQGLRIRTAYVDATKYADGIGKVDRAYTDQVDVKRARATKTLVIDTSKADRDWVTKTYGKPLTTQAVKTQAQLDDLEKRLPKMITTAVATAVAVSLEPIARTLTQVKTQLAKINEEIDTCVIPMCDTMGPKTDLGKLLKGLKVAKWLAIFAALETIDVKDLEALALAVAGTEGKLGDFVAEHVLDELEAEHP